MCSPSPPPPPDYAGAANATAQGNLEAARAAAAANRVNQVTPYGSLTYSRDPNAATPDDGWTATQTLSPDQQALLDRQNETSLGLADTMGQGVSYVQNMMNQPFDQSALPAQMVNPGQTGQDAIMARLNPQIAQDRAALDSKLANQGITQGSEAWQNAMRQRGNQENDLYSQAALHGIGVGQQARQQGIQEQSFFRNEPINTLNAVRTGAQVQNPQFTSVPQQATTAGPDLLGAANMQYNGALGASNASAASSANTTSGIVGLAGAAAMAF